LTRRNGGQQRGNQDGKILNQIAARIRCQTSAPAAAPNSARIMCPPLAGHHPRRRLRYHRPAMVATCQNDKNNQILF
jgi:hypothetical protein